MLTSLLMRGDSDSAVFVSKKLISLHPDSSENVFYLAESYRTLGPRNAELTAQQLTSGAKKKAAKTRAKRTLEEQEAELFSDVQPARKHGRSNSGNV